MKDLTAASAGKFVDPHVTADGAPRARVPLSDPQALWFNTGTLCNITCRNCYIDSSPDNDALAYITAAEVSGFLDQLDARDWLCCANRVKRGLPLSPDALIPRAL